MKVVYLHLGLHKTASSSFQETCKLNKGLLSSLGYDYPIFNSEHIGLNDICNHSVPFYSMFAKNPNLYHVNIKNADCNIDELNDDYMKTIKEYFSSDNDIIISGEDISRLSLNEMLSLKKFFESNGCRVKAFSIVRSPYEFHCSAIQQRVKTGSYVNFRKLISQKSEITKITKAFPECEFIPFRDIVKFHKDPVLSILNKIGLSEDDCRKIIIKKSNEGVSNLMVRLQNKLNSMEPKILNGKINLSWRRVQNKFDDGKFVLTPMELRAIESQLDSENIFFERKLHSKFLDKEYSTRSKSDLYEDFIKQTLKKHIPR